MKKIIGVMTAAIGLLLLLSACTASGMPTSLVGVWKTETKIITNQLTGDTTTDVSYVEFTDDDYMISASTKDILAKLKQDKKQCKKIIKATCNELHIIDGAILSEDSYSIIKYELTGTTLTLTQPNYDNWAYYTVCVYTKDE